MAHLTSSKVALALLLSAAVMSLPSVVSARNLCLQTSDGLDLVLPSFHVKRGSSFPVNGWTAQVFANATRVQHQPVSGQAIATRDGRQVSMGLTIYGAAIVKPINPSGPAQGCCGLSNGVEYLTVDLAAGSDGSFTDGTGGSLVARMRVSPFGGVEQVFVDSHPIVFDCPTLGDLALP